MNSKTKGKKLTKFGKLWVESAVKDMKIRERKKTEKKKRKKKKTEKKKRKIKKTEKKKFIQKISEKKYKALIQKRRKNKRLTKREEKLLDTTLFYKYCKCNLNFEEKDQNGYGICMNSIYKNRGFKTPSLKKGKRCKDIYIK